KALLLKESYISEADSKAAESVSHDTAGYIDYLIRAQLLSKALLGQALAEASHVPFADLAINQPVRDQVAAIPEVVARANRVVLTRRTSQAVEVASDIPERLDMATLKQIFPGKQISVAYTLPEYINQAFELYEQPLATRFSKILSESNRVAPQIVD